MGSEVDGYVTRMGARFTTTSDGVSDVSVGGTYTFHHIDGFAHQFLIGIDAYFPTGSIDARGDTPLATDVRLPYPMQLGST